jgi:signal transduction histidine kinase
VTLTPRRRALIAVLVSWPLAWAYVDIGWRLVFHLLEILRNPSGYVGCTSPGGLPGLIERFNGCGFGVTYRWPYALVELLLMSAVAGLVAYGLARWVTWPIRAMTASVQQLGPTNLGLRIRPAGPSADESRALGEAIDRMLDRVSEGYEAQRRFAANASHELRTPLATQRALIEVSMSGALTPDQLDLLSRQLLATNVRNEKLVEGLLVLAETERGLMSRTPLRLDRITADAVSMMRPAAADREVYLRTELTTQTVAGEAPLLERLVTNLVGNAIKYNEPGGSATVQVTSPGRLIVTNTGPRIDASEVARFFEPFRRASGERLDHGDGVGLGLTIARSIVAAHGGRIDARANEDGGLTVTVDLPTADSPG